MRRRCVTSSLRGKGSGCQEPIPQALERGQKRHAEATLGNMGAALEQRAVSSISSIWSSTTLSRRLFALPHAAHGSASSSLVRNSPSAMRSSRVGGPSTRSVCVGDKMHPSSDADASAAASPTGTAPTGTAPTGMAATGTVAAGTAARALPHIRQSFNWDCGLACTEMVLRALGIQPDLCAQVSRPLPPPPSLAATLPFRDRSFGDRSFGDRRFGDRYFGGDPSASLFLPPLLPCAPPPPAPPPAGQTTRARCRPKHLDDRPRFPPPQESVFSHCTHTAHMSHAFFPPKASGRSTSLSSTGKCLLSLFSLSLFSLSLHPFGRYLARNFPPHIQPGSLF